MTLLVSIWCQYGKIYFNHLKRFLVIDLTGYWWIIATSYHTNPYQIIPPPPSKTVDGKLTNNGKGWHLSKNPQFFSPFLFFWKWSDNGLIVFFTVFFCSKKRTFWFCKSRRKASTKIDAFRFYFWTKNRYICPSRYKTGKNLQISILENYKIGCSNARIFTNFWGKFWVLFF